MWRPNAGSGSAAARGQWNRLRPCGSQVSQVLCKGRATAEVPFEVQRVRILLAAPKEDSAEWGDKFLGAPAQCPIGRPATAPAGEQHIGRPQSLRRVELRAVSVPRADCASIAEF